MNSYQSILEKLGSFTRKYYTKQLVKGLLLFFAFGLLFWIAVISLEYLLWLSGGWRLFLFLAFVTVEAVLLFRWVAIPLAYLTGIRKGISNKDASRVIARYFPEVGDKLQNLIELSENKHKSELLLASIEQRAESLRTVPFVEAVNFKESFKHGRYLAIPLFIFGLVWFAGDIAAFFDSHKRMVNYDVAYEQPAPFSFRVLNESLEVLDNEPLRIEVEILGDYRPDNVFIVVHGEEILMRQDSGAFVHSFDAPVESTSFYLTSNGWDSKYYEVRILKTPVLRNFAMKLGFPSYVKRKDEIVTGTGNAVVLEGTKITWVVDGVNLEDVRLADQDTVGSFSKNDGTFEFRREVFDDMDYEITTGNKNVADFERLQYHLDVVKDEYPTIEVVQKMDSLSPNQSYFSGQVGDDYQVREVRVVCYPANDQSDIKKRTLLGNVGVVSQFYYTFPSGFDLQDGVDYKIYFEVVDNDGLKGGKVARSATFNSRLNNSSELINRELEYQENVLDKFERSVENYKEQEGELEKINERQREQSADNFETKSQLKDFLRRQEEQEQLMEKFSKELKETLSKEDKNNQQRKLLKERLERQELEARKNKKLLDELEKLSDLIEKEELKKKLEELGKKQSSNARSLEQILELTKRYYVTEKMKKVSSDLEELSKKQLDLSKLFPKKDYQTEQQENLNKEFQELSKEIDELRKDNDALKKPLKMDVEPKDQEAVGENQKDALDGMDMMKEQEGNTDKESQSKEIQQRQKSAAERLKEMSEAMQQSASGGEAGITEDAEMLRQILDNLVVFSFKQEKLLEDVETSDVDISQFSGTVRSQKELRNLFEHVDDSLFALSLRRAELADFVNEQITEVYYNIDRSLESIAENQIFQGVSYQQYVVNATNALADFLANTLDNMQQSMKPGQGGGGKGGFQLPDIIQGQQGIQDKMNGSGQSGKQGGEEGKEDGNGKEGEGEGKEEGSKPGGKGGSSGQGDKQGGQSGGDGTGDGEMGLGEVYEIYKEQQRLRRELEEQLKNFINKAEGDLAKKLLRQMEDFENDLLEKGITERTRNKANVIQHELLKLRDASLQQGERKEREGETNQVDFTNPITTKPALLEDGANDIEILNRQALPLRRNYENKVKVYFRND